MKITTKFIQDGQTKTKRDCYQKLCQNAESCRLLIKVGYSFPVFLTLPLSPQFFFNDIAGRVRFRFKPVKFNEIKNIKET